MILSTGAVDLVPVAVFRRMRAGRLLIAALLCALVAGAPARAEDPPLVNWPALLPALAVGFTPATFDTCPDGSRACLEATLRELRRRIADHDAACSDNALFARNYRLITDFYSRVAGTGFFADDLFLAREDAIFANLYFAAEDNWRAGRHEDVPEAWRIAFQAADDKQVQGAGNLLLGINAHVQRDQPYMLAGLGLVDEQGRSRKPDHDKFNELLNTAYDDVIAQATAQDDPDLAMYEVPGTQADNLLAFQTIAGWREGVWRNAERLVRATSDAERAFVAQSIEDNAAAWARLIRDSFAYRPPFDRDRRDALCPERARRAAAERAALAAGERRTEGDVTCTATGIRSLHVRVRRRRVSARGGVWCRPTPVRVSVTRAGRRPRWRRLPARLRFAHTTRRLRPGRYVVRVRAAGTSRRRTVAVR